MGLVACFALPGADLLEIQTAAIKLLLGVVCAKQADIHMDILQAFEKLRIKASETARYQSFCKLLRKRLDDSKSIPDQWQFKVRHATQAEFACVVVGG